MGLLTLKLTDAERAKLDAKVEAGGFRSIADAVRAWLDEPDPHRMVEAGFEQRKAEHREKLEKLKQAGLVLTGLQVGPSAPKPGSRLKGSK